MLSIIIPTKNEQDNIQELISKLWLVGADEVLVVDDSTDNTKARALESGARVIQGKGSLGGSVIEGFKQAKRDLVCVMDGDLSHDPSYIPLMLNHFPEMDLVIGSRQRFHEGTLRNLISKIGAKITGLRVKDPITGFFLIKKDKIPKNLRCKGFKILYEILQNSNLKIKEIPIYFNNRTKGKSKFNLKEMIYFLYQVGKRNQFIKYSVVGGLGVLINLGLLYILTELGFYYLLSGVIGFVVSFILNYQLNKKWTFKKS